MAVERGIKLAVPKASSLLDACNSQAERFYGYDCVDLAIKREENGMIVVSYTPKAEFPTAEEIEERYDHSQPTVPQHLITGETP